MICEEGDLEFKKDNIGNEDITSMIGDDESFGGDEKDMTNNQQFGMYDNFPETCNNSNETPTVSVNTISPIIDGRTPLQLSIDSKIKD